MGCQVSPGFLGLVGSLVREVVWFSQGFVRFQSSLVRVQFGLKLNSVGVCFGFSSGSVQFGLASVRVQLRLSLRSVQGLHGFQIGFREEVVANFVDGSVRVRCRLT